MAEGETRIQLCGRFVVRMDGERVEGRLPGRKGRLVLAYLVLNRSRTLSRDELLMAGWGDDASADAGPALSVTLSKLRSVVGERLGGRSELTFDLPADAVVDVEAAIEGAHRAELCIARRDWAGAWGPAAVACHVAERPLMSGFEAPWLEQWRRELEDVRRRGLEAFAAAALGLGGPALGAGDRAVRLLRELAPYRESVHALHIELLAASGNVAEALRAYDALRVQLVDELGVAPGPGLQELHRRLLAG